VRATCTENGISIRVVREARVSAIWADASRLSAVLSNVLRNAVKYTPSGGTIEIRTQSVDAGSAVCIVVTDSGPGVPPEQRERVFEKFFRVEHQRRDPEGGERGAGIGLYIARQIVVAHGGAIHCGSGPSGAGACFSVTLPVKRQDASSVSARSA
jgi:two-component system, NtrC family, sensor histidine kinase KinB